jgi:ribosomal protein L7/L12
MILLYIAFIILILCILLIIVVQARIPTPPANVSDEDIQQLARNGRKSQAIAWYRSLHGVGLTEAKEAVEAMMRNP